MQIQSCILNNINYSIFHSPPATEDVVNIALSAQYSFQKSHQQYIKFLAKGQQEQEQNQDPSDQSFKTFQGQFQVSGSSGTSSGSDRINIDLFPQTCTGSVNLCTTSTGCTSSSLPLIKM